MFLLDGMKALEAMAVIPSFSHLLLQHPAQCQGGPARIYNEVGQYVLVLGEGEQLPKFHRPSSLLPHPTVLENHEGTI